MKFALATLFVGTLIFQGNSSLLEKADELFKLPVFQVLFALATIVGIVVGLFKWFKSIAKRNSVANEIAKATIENLTTLMEARDIDKFNDAGDPSYKNRLQQIIEDNNSTDRSISLFGSPGIGKSFLAQEVAYQYAITPIKKRKFDVVWWIDAENISKKNLGPEPNQNDDLTRLARLGFDLDTAQPNWLIELMKALSKVDFLLVFDNACDVGDGQAEKTIREFKNAFFPGTDPRKHQKIIITSRNRDWGNGIELLRWNLEEFSFYLARHLDEEQAFDTIENDVSTDEKLHKELDGLPLAASLAAAFMVENRCKPLSYFELIRDKAKYRNQVKISKAFELSYSALSDDSAKVLSLMSFLSPNEIPLKELISYQQQQAEGANGSIALVNRVTEALVQLKKYALITAEDGGKFYSIHRLWQEAIHEILKEQGIFESVYANALAFLVQASKGFIGTDYPYFRSILQHIESFAIYVKPGDNENVISDLVKLLRSAGNYSFQIGAVAQAMRLNAQVIAIAPNDLKLLHEIGLSNSHNLILRDHCQDAMALAAKAYNYFADVYDGEDKLKLTEKARQAVGKVKQREGYFAEAKQLFEISKQIIETYDAEHSVVGEITNIKKEIFSGLLHDLGSVWWEEGLDYTKSIQFFDEAIAFKLSINGGVTKDLYLNLSKMIKGVALGLMGNYDEQSEIHKEVFEFLSTKDYEQRRKVYTGYYLLNFGWDRIDWKNRNNNEKTIYESYYSVDEKTAEVLEGDVKYSIIKAVVDLRKIVREGLTIGNRNKAQENYQVLIAILENKNKKLGARFLDDGTVAVSAVLDYAFYLDEVVERKSEAQINQIKAVIQFAIKMLTIKDNNGYPLGRIVYNRSADLDSLCEKYQVAC